MVAAAARRKNSQLQVVAIVDSAARFTARGMFSGAVAIAIAASPNATAGICCLAASPRPPAVHCLHNVQALPALDVAAGKRRERELRDVHYKNRSNSA